MDTHARRETRRSRKGINAIPIIVITKRALGDTLASTSCSQLIRREQQNLKSY